MKKIARLLLVLCIMITIVGCSSNSDETSESSSTSASQAPSASKTEEIPAGETTAEQTTPPDEQTAATEEPVIETPVTDSATEDLSILKLNKKNLYKSKWSKKYRIPLVTCESSSIFLNSEDSERYPELSAAMTETANYKKRTLKEDYAVLTKIAKEKISYGADGFSPLISTFDAHVRRADSNVVSILVENHYFNGTADSGTFWGENYDTKTGNSILFSDVVTNVDDFALVAEDQLLASARADVFRNDDIIKEYFAMYGADGTHWTLDYNGVTVYFSEGEIADSGFGAMNVTVTFAEHPELFNEKYITVPESYIVSLPTKTIFHSDFDGDGRCEDLSIVDSYDDESDYSATVTIDMARDFYSENFWAYDCEPYYIKTSDDKHYLYLFAELETQMYLYVYNITGGKISRVGEVNVSPFYNDGVFAVPTDPECMHFDIFSDEAGGGISEGNDFFSIGVDGIPGQG